MSNPELSQPKKLPKIYSSYPPVLVVEDNDVQRNVLFEIVSSVGVKCETVSNGKDGLDLASKNQYSVYIVDLMMPIMDGSTFIKELKKTHEDAVILVQTALDSSDVIIEIMKLGIFDYVIKPINIQAFHSTLEKSLDFSGLKKMEKDLSINAGLKLRSQLEWLNYKELRTSKGEDSKDSLTLKHLKDSLSQGSGIGALITLVDMLSISLVPQGDNYLVKKDIVDMLLKNSQIVSKMIDGIMNISNTLQTSFSLSKSNAKDIIDWITASSQKVTPYLKNKNLKITFPTSSAKYDIDINKSKFMDVIDELLINAYKYSKKNSSINIFTYIKDGYLCISIKNDIVTEPYGGIPSEYEKMVLEPFFRILPPDESISELEKYPIGLGLTVVDYVVKKHNGLFFIHDIIDHTGKDTKKCVLAEVFLPISF